MSSSSEDPGSTNSCPPRLNYRVRDDSKPHVTFSFASKPGVLHRVTSALSGCELRALHCSSEESWASCLTVRDVYASVYTFCLATVLGPSTPNRVADRKGITSQFWDLCVRLKTVIPTRSPRQPPLVNAAS